VRIPDSRQVRQYRTIGIEVIRAWPGLFVDERRWRGILKRWIVVFWALASFAPAGMGSTLLTNGIPVSFQLPAAPTAGSLYSGDFGYAIYVPPGATALTIDLSFNESLYAPYSVDILARFGADVGFTSGGLIAFDHSSPTVGYPPLGSMPCPPLPGPPPPADRNPQTPPCSPSTGSKELVINQQSIPPLRTGTYYIAFRVNTTGLTPVLTLTAAVTGGSIAPINIVAISTFDNDTDGWVRNSASSSLPGASQGGPNANLVWQSSQGNPGGYIQLYGPVSAAADALVAPGKFLGNLSKLTDPRFEFDFLQLTGSDPTFPVEIRIFSANAAFSWTGSVPPGPPIFNNGEGICDSVCELPLNASPPNTECAPLPPTNSTRCTTTSECESLGPGFTCVNESGTTFGGICVGTPPSTSVSPNIPQCTCPGQTRSGVAICLDIRGGAATCTNLAYDPFVAKFRCLSPNGNPGVPGAGGRATCTNFVFNPVTGNEDCARPWTHYTAALQSQFWTRIAGTGTFAQTLADVERIEVLTHQTLYGESDGLDNFALVARGPGQPPMVLPGNTTFVSGADGWSANYPASSIAGATTGNADSTFRYVAFGGNPNGFIRLNNSGGPNRDYVVAPSRFLGNYQNIANPQFEFDYQHVSSGGATLPVQMRLIGASSVFVWTGSVPPTGIWTHYIAPLTEANWQRVSGGDTLAQALTNVLRIEISMDQAPGPEWDGIDNFWLLPGSVNPAPPAITANPPALSFSATAGGPNPAPQAISVTSIGGGTALSFTASASAGAGWLKVSAPNGTTPYRINVWPDLAGLQPGTYSGVVTIVTQGAPIGPQAVAVSLTVNAPARPAPQINNGGAVNAASNKTQLAPGSLGTLYGTALGPAGGVSASFLPGTTQLPTRLQGVRLLVNETYGALIAEAPLLYISDTQINFQLPFETFGRAEVGLVVDNNGLLSGSIPVQVVPISPGIFTYGNNRAVAVNADNSLNSSTAPALRGSVMTVYMTGQGTVAPAVPTGAAAPVDPLARAPFPAQAWIGGAPARILFLGLTPGLVGVLQLNLVVPPSAPTGDSPLVVNIGGWTSNTPSVSVR
jgi:uncharacterized protein (TIGR03437 family)